MINGTVLCKFLNEHWGKIFYAWNEDNDIQWKITLDDVEDGETEKDGSFFDDYVILDDSRLVMKKERKKVSLKLPNKNKILKLLPKIVEGELKTKLNDLLYLEEIERRLKNFSGKKIEDDKILYYFLGNIVNREWIVKELVNKLLKECGLPNKEILIEISAQFYEKRTIKTKMCFTDKTDEIKLWINFNDLSVNINSENGNMRSIRKLMEISGENYSLLIDKKNYIIKGVIDKNDDTAYGIYIEFLDHLEWCISERRKKTESPCVLLHYKNGIYKFPVLEGKEDKNEWKKDIASILSKWGMSEKQEKLEKIVEKLKKQPHGTSIVFFKEKGQENGVKGLKNEVARLSKFYRAYRIDEIDLENADCNEIMGMSAIDGALLADIDGKCSAIGAILDGVSVVAGDIGRGARYNSLNNYVKWRNDEKDPIRCFAVILSEDQMVNVGIP